MHRTTTSLVFVAAIAAAMVFPWHDVRAAQGAELVLQSARSMTVGPVAVSPDGQLLAIANRLFDLNSGMLLQTFPPVEIPATVCRDKDCKQQNWQRHFVPNPRNNGIAFSPDGRYFAMISESCDQPDSSIGAAWAVETGQLATPEWRGTGTEPRKAPGFPYDSETMCQWKGTRSSRQIDKNTYMNVSPHGTLGAFGKEEGKTTRLIVQDLKDGKEIWRKDVSWSGNPFFSANDQFLVREEVKDTNGRNEFFMVVEELSSGKELARVPGREASFSKPSERWLCVRKSQWELSLLDTSTWKIAHQIKLHETEDPVEPEYVPVAFGPGEEWMIDGMGYLYDLKTGESKRVISSASTEPINSMTISPNSDQLAVATYADANHRYGKGIVAVWKMADQDRITRITTENAAYAVAFTPDGNVVAGTEIRDIDGKGHELHVGEVALWDVTSSKQVRSFNGPSKLGEDMTGSSRILAISKGGKHLAAAKRDILAFQDCSDEAPCGFEDIQYIGLLQVWDPNTGEVQLNKRLKDGIFEGIAISPKGQNVATITSGSKLLIWNLPKREVTWSVEAQSGWIQDRDTGAVLEEFAPRVIRPIVFSPDGNYLALSNTTGAFSIWTLPQKEPVFSASEESYMPEAWTSALAFTPDSAFLLVGDCTGRVMSVATSDWQPKASASAHSGCVSDIVVSNDGKWAASASLDGTIKLWLVPTLQPLATFIADPSTGEWLVVAPDGSYDCSKNGGELAGWRTGRRIQPISADASKRKPGLLLEIAKRIRPESSAPTN